MGNRGLVGPEMTEVTQDGLALVAHGLCHTATGLLVSVLFPEDRPSLGPGLKRLLPDYVKGFALRYLSIVCPKTITSPLSIGPPGDNAFPSEASDFEFLHASIS